MNPPSNLAPPLAVSLSGVTLGGTARGQIEWAAAMGFRGVALNAAVAGLRPRELDRSARRDLASLLRRLELRFAGVELLIPRAHFIEPERSDKALAATSQALAFTAEMAVLCHDDPVLSLEIPRGDAGAPVRASLAAEADRVGARIADTGWPPLDPAPEDLDRLGVGLDPAAVLLSGADPAVEALRFGDRLLSARVSDLDSAGRTTPGEGRLDLDAYAATLTTSGYGASALLDLRNIRDQQGAAGATLRRWGGSSPV